MNAIKIIIGMNFNLLWYYSFLNKNYSLSNRLVLKKPLHL